MRKVRNAQQHITQCELNLFCFSGQTSFGVAQCAAFCHYIFSSSCIASLTQRTYLFREAIHLLAQGIALERDVAQAGIEFNGVLKLFQQVGLATAGKGRPHHSRVIT